MTRVSKQRTAVEPLPSPEPKPQSESNSETIMLSVVELRVNNPPDSDLICRAGGINKKTLVGYVEAARNGAEFPPIVVFRDQDGKHWLADGHHRLAVAEAIHEGEIKARVHEGGREQALLYAASSNDSHGLRRTNADKRRAVELVLKACSSDWSDRRVAEACGVSHPFIARVRVETVTSSGQKAGYAEGADGKIRAAKPASFDLDRELARVGKVLGDASRWPESGRKTLLTWIGAWATPTAETESAEPTKRGRKPPTKTESERA